LEEPKKNKQKRQNPAFLKVSTAINNLQIPPMPHDKGKEGKKELKQGRTKNVFLLTRKL